MTITLNGTTGITLPNGSASTPAETGTDTDSGVFYGTNTVSIATGGTTAVTVDSSQNVGIGTSSPLFKLSTLGNANIGNNDSSNPLNYLRFGATQYGAADIRPTDEGSHKVGLSFYTDGTADTTINPTERMRIDSSGNLLVGTTSSTIGSDNGLVAIKRAASGYSMILGSAQTGSISYMIKFTYDNTTGTGQISTTNTTVSYATSSDYRLKENVAPMTGALDTVAALKPVTYNWKIDGSIGQGFIAHELAEVVPEAVVGDKDAIDENGNPVYQGIDTSFLVATLTAAIQELKAELDTVKTELATLKGTA